MPEENTAPDEKSKKPILEAKNISKAYGSVQALRGVDIELCTVEVMGLIGDNGAGKSTLVGCLSGSTTPDSGEIRLDGKRVSINNPEAARSMGMSATQSMRYVILPQAIRNMIPALTGELISLIKESALLFVISLSELTLVARQLAAHEGSTLEFYTVLAVYYLMLTIPLAGASHLLEGKLSLK